MTAAAWKQRVATAFDQAAADYDQHARLQRRVASELFEQINSQVETTQVKTGLEIGCGTGFLTLPLVSHYSRTHWTVTDVAPRMLDRCREQLHSAALDSHRVTLLRQDGEDVNPADNAFDLVCSNLTFQWFTDWQRALQGLMDCVQPGGCLAFTTLAAGTFDQVNQYFGPPALGAGYESYLDERELQPWLAELSQWRLELHVEQMTEQYASPGEFLQSLKAIGACTSIESEPRKISEMRSMLQAATETVESFEADYRVLFVLLHREAAS